MNKNKNINMVYAGSKGDLVVLEDKTNGIVNFCCHSANDTDIEMWSFQKSDVEKIKGTESLFEKTVACFISMFVKDAKTGKKLGIQEPKLQSFPLSFWDDVIIPMKNGKMNNFVIEMMEGK